MKLLQRAAARYKDARGLRMECLVTRTQTERLQENHGHKIVDRRYRLWANPHDFRMDMIGEKDGQITRLATGGRALIYSSYFQQFAEGDSASDEFQAVMEHLNRHRGLFYQRFADLPEFRPIVTALAPAVLKVQGRKIECQRLSFQSPPTLGSKWTGEIWVEGESGLVWRSRLKTVRDGWEVDEDIRWLQIETCTDCSEQIVNWRPPEGTGRVSASPMRLP